MSQSLSDIAKLLEHHLKECNCVLYPPELILGGMRVLDNLQQWNITAGVNEEWPETTIKELAFKIYSTNINVTFMELALPSNGIEIACTCRRGKILFRYLEAHRIQSDDSLKRIDVLMRK